MQKTATGKRILHNPIVGGLSLWSAVGQFIGADAKELRAFANENLYKYFRFFRELFSFPVDMHIVTATERTRKRIKSMYDYYTFIKSDDSLHALHTGKAEVILLASIINQPITILHFQEQGFPSGTPLEERCHLEVYEPLKYPLIESNYHQSEGPWILKEDLHFSLLVPSADDLDDPLDVDAFIASMQTSLFPGEMDGNDNGEDQEQHLRQQEEQYRREEPAQDPQYSNSSYDQQNCPYSQSTPSTSSSPNYTSPSCHSSSSHSLNVTGRPQRLRKRKVIFDNSEPEVKRKKTVLTRSIERLIKPPTENQKRKEREEQEKHEQMRLSQEAHRAEMEELEERAQQLKRKREREDEISRELQIQSNHLRENLSERDMIYG